MTHPSYDAALARAARQEAENAELAAPDSTWARGAMWSGEPVQAHKIARGHGADEYGDGALSFAQFRAMVGSPRRGQPEDLTVWTPPEGAPIEEAVATSRSRRFLRLR